MRWSVRILISIMVLVFVSLGGLVLYNVAHSRGQTAGIDSGYSDGYSLGQQVGYSQGRQDGYDAGESDGYSNGYSSGYSNGYSFGKHAGYIEGYVSGKDTGYRAGYGDGVRASVGHGYTLRDPVYEEVIKFLFVDRTDENEFTEGSYVSTHYAMDVNNKAEAEGWRSAFVLISYEEGGHAVVAFDTVDRGLLYFEPQTDEQIELEIGQQYGDGIVQDISIIW